MKKRRKKKGRGEEKAENKSKFKSLYVNVIAKDLARGKDEEWREECSRNGGRKGNDAELED